MSQIIREADRTTSVLLIHAPYPGRLKFDGEPSSLLHAVTPAVQRLVDQGLGGTVGLLDPREASETFYRGLEGILGGEKVRIVAISTSSAAIQETETIVKLVRRIAGESVLVLVGGPHEDDCERKSAEAIAGIDLSIGGDAEHPLALVIPDFLNSGQSPAAFSSDLPARTESLIGQGGKGTLASPWWDGPTVRPFDLGRLDIRKLKPRCTSTRPVRFSVFESKRTLPVMVGRGCSYGRCSFCAEGIGSDRASVLSEFDWLQDHLAINPGAAVYFQDSIFPNTRAVQDRLLPLLRAADREWGCQVYLPMLSRRMVGELARHGCRYVYTGIESGSTDILSAVGKSGLSRALLLERLGWIRDAGIRVGLSVMFGAVDDEVNTLETRETLRETVRLCHEIDARGISVAGYYPNVETVLPGTKLARSVAANLSLDWYRPPHTAAFEKAEDGFVGFNFASIAAIRRNAQVEEPLMVEIPRAMEELIGLGDKAW